VIDLIATQSQYRAHLDPLWAALPERGEVVARARDRTSTAALVAGFQDMVRARRWGYSHIAYLEHGIGQSYGNGHPAYPGGREREAVGLFLSPNETAAAADRAAYPRARVAVIGAPRLDTLPRRVPDGLTTIAVSFHWSGGAVPELRSALDHYRSALYGLGLRWHVIGHSHPRVDLSELYRSLGWEYVRDFDEVCRRADVYVCDNSSTLYEFASTGRPVVVLNAPWFRRDVSLGLRFWEAAGVGVTVDEPRYLEPCIFGALADPLGVFAASREAALAIAYGLRTNAAAAGATAVLDWLAAEAVAA
jgi:hypothetical protein